MITIDGKCKICAIPLKLKTEPEYADVGDVFKLVPMATCSPCYDRKVRHDRIERAIGNLCNQLRVKVDKVTLAKITEAMHILTKSYADVMGAICFSPQRIIWDEAFGELLIERPDRWGMILQKYRDDCERELRRAA